jgi:hypothetical protein
VRRFAFFLPLIFVPALALAQIGGAFSGSSPPASSGDRSFANFLDGAPPHRVTGFWLQNCSCAGGDYNMSGMVSSTFSFANGCDNSNPPYCYAFGQTQATLNSVAGYLSSLQFPSTSLPTFEAQITTAAAANLLVVRYAAGMSGIDLAGVDTTPTQAIWFRFSTAAGDTNWMACSSLLSTTSCTSTGVAVAASTVYTLKIDATTAGTALYYVNNVLKVTKTTNMPNALGTSMVKPQVRVQTLEAVAKSLGVSSVRVSYLGG